MRGHGASGTPAAACVHEHCTFELHCCYRNEKNSEKRRAGFNGIWRGMPDAVKMKRGGRVFNEKELLF